jgi:D-aminopeptidase
VTGRKRAREHGISFGGTCGQWNAITDVPGVEVGYRTLIRDEPDGRAVRTGVTAILPRGASGVGIPVAAAIHSLNGNGEMTGKIWLDESGSLGTPIMITNTHSVGAAHEAAIAWTIEHAPNAAEQWLLPVVAETWDGILNDINGLHVRPTDGRAAIDAARSGPVEEGAVGGGTGMICYDFKGGSGTASRRVPIGAETYTVGVFVQANFGDRRELTIQGLSFPHDAAPYPVKPAAPPPGAGSVIVIVATDAPLLPGQCKAMARRVSLGLARTGTSGSHFSGDIFLAFSTANEGALRSDFPLDVADPRIDTIRFLEWGRMDPLYEAVVQATEEAVVNVLIAGEAMSGNRGSRVSGFPNDIVPELLRGQIPGD